MFYIHPGAKLNWVREKVREVLIKGAMMHYDSWLYSIQLKFPEKFPVSSLGTKGTYALPLHITPSTVFDSDEWIFYFLQLHVPYTMTASHRDMESTS